MCFSAYTLVFLHYRETFLHVYAWTKSRSWLRLHRELCNLCELNDSLETMKLWLCILVFNNSCVSFLMIMKWNLCFPSHEAYGPIRVHRGICDLMIIDGCSFSFVIAHKEYAWVHLNFHYLSLKSWPLLPMRMTTKLWAKGVLWVFICIWELKILYVFESWRWWIMSLICWSCFIETWFFIRCKL